MTSEDIKKECETIQNTIQACKKRLEDIQKECKHLNTVEGNFSWRIGCIDQAIFCSDCNKLITNFIPKVI